MKSDNILREIKLVFMDLIHILNFKIQNKRKMHTLATLVSSSVSIQ